MTNKDWDGKQAQVTGMLDALKAFAGPLEQRPQDNPVPTCDRCGNPCNEGYSTRYYGNADLETGYRDQETLCADCEDNDVSTD